VCVPGFCTHHHHHYQRLAVGFLSVDTAGHLDAGSILMEKKLPFHTHLFLRWTKVNIYSTAVQFFSDFSFLFQIIRGAYTQPIADVVMNVPPPFLSLSLCII
jgi:hypothetical protein